ncbi:uncharacterized protein B0T15DRAFT_511126 [Chaetomium strumarium]|uniref:Uncharacterized protein n=1 Tax=Chaetomium strumarium TaxID=1170767 RepID=A0AAJ0M165_9PEZI|nr:hypothetical protein B0T15DRAFT_511126 [Chaetomium strumarium]
MPRTQQKGKGRKGVASRAQRHARETTSRRQARARPVATGCRREIRDESGSEDGSEDGSEESGAEESVVEESGADAGNDDEFTLPSLPGPRRVPELPSAVCSALEEWLRNIRERHSLSSKRLPKELNAGEYARVTELVSDPLWQADDTAQLDQQANAYVQFLAGHRRQPELETMWRLVPRFMRCLPPALFEDRNLEYDSSGNPQLLLLVVHPFFQGSPALLAVVLQYAAKLRTNDHRRWPVHTEVRKALREQGKLLPPISTLLREMEKNIRVSATPSAASSDSFAPYPVALADVKAAIHALNELHIRGAPAFGVPAELNYKWVQSNIHSHDPPKGWEGVIEAMERAHKRSLQAKILAERRLPPPSSALPAPPLPAVTGSEGPAIQRSADPFAERPPHGGTPSPAIAGSGVDGMRQGDTELSPDTVMLEGPDLLPLEDEYVFHFHPDPNGEEVVVGRDLAGRQQEEILEEKEEEEGGKTEEENEDDVVLGYRYAGK